MKSTLSGQSVPSKSNSSTSVTSQEEGPQSTSSQEEAPQSTSSTHPLHLKTNSENEIEKPENETRRFTSIETEDEAETSVNDRLKLEAFYNPDPERRRSYLYTRYRTSLYYDPEDNAKEPIIVKRPSKFKQFCQDLLNLLGLLFSIVTVASAALSFYYVFPNERKLSKEILFLGKVFPVLSKETSTTHANFSSKKEQHIPREEIELEFNRSVSNFEEISNEYTTVALNFERRTQTTYLKQLNQVIFISNFTPALQKDGSDYIIRRLFCYNRLLVIDHQVLQYAYKANATEKYLGRVNITDCGILKRMGHNKSGVYTVYIKYKPFQVYCDMVTSGGGWTVIQRRVDDTVNFDRKYEEYIQGFGNLTHNFWFGINTVYSIASFTKNTLRIDMADFRNNTAYAEYRDFKLGGSYSKFSISAGGYFGTAGDAIGSLKGAKFCAIDRDYDNSGSHCGEIYRTGWWFKQCANVKSNLNGVYTNDVASTDRARILWTTWTGGTRVATEPLKWVEIKMRKT